MSKLTDKNNNKLYTGQVVKVENAYFKNDNGYFYIEHSPEDPDWSGLDYCLRKINKNGKISSSRHNIGFWPISVFVNNYEKRELAKEHNSKFATIEIVPTFDTTAVRERFSKKASEARESYKLQMCYNNYGYDLDKHAEFYDKVADGSWQG